MRVKSSGTVVMSLSSAVSSDSIGGGCGAWMTPNTPAPIVGAMVCNAATRYARKRVGSFSPSSNDNQAVGRSHPATHSPTSVVFPKPAGAEMRVSLRCSPSFSRSIRRGRRTAFGRRGGIYSFVAKIGGTTHQVYGARSRSSHPWRRARRSADHGRDVGRRSGWPSAVVPGGAVPHPCSVHLSRPAFRRSGSARRRTSPRWAQHHGHIVSPGLTQPADRFIVHNLRVHLDHVPST